MNIKPLHTIFGFLLIFYFHFTLAQDHLWELYYAGNYNQVIESGSGLLARGDTALSTFHLKALSEIRLGHTGASIRTLERALQYYPGEPVISRTLAGQYFETADYLSARNLYLGLVRNDSTDIASWLKLAEIAAFRQQYGRAAEALDLVLRIDSANLGGLLMMGDILDRQNHSGAMEYYELAYRICPDNQKVSYALANYYLQAQKAEEAIPICQHMLKNDSTSIKFRKMAGYVYYKTGDPLPAIRHFRYAAEAGDSTAFTYKFMGICQYLASDFQGAIESLLTAAEKDSLDAETRFFLGSSLATTKNKTEAMAHLSKSLELMRPDPEVVARIYSEQGNIKRLTGEYEEAYTLYDKAWKADTTSPISLYFMASILDNSLHRSREALVDYQRFIDQLELQSEPEKRGGQIPSIRTIVEDRIVSLKEELFFLDER